MAENGIACPNCGKQVTIPDDMEKCFCPYCAAEVSRVVPAEPGEEAAEAPSNAMEEVETGSAGGANAETPSEAAEESASDTPEDSAAEIATEAKDVAPSEEVQVTEGQEVVVPPASLAESAGVVSDSAKAEPEKKSKKGLVIGLVSAAVVAVIVLVIVFAAVIPGNKYSEAIAAYDAGDYQTAMQGFVELGDYSDAKGYMYDCALRLTSQGEFDYVLNELSQIDDPEAATYYSYAVGMKALDEERYDEAAEEFSKAPDFPYAQFALGLIKMAKKKYSDAIDIFAATATLEASDKTMITNCAFMTAECYYNQGKMNTAKTMYKKLPLSFGFGKTTVYERLAAIALLGDDGTGMWRVYKWYGTDGDGNAGITKKGSELEDWGYNLEDGTFFGLNKVRFFFATNGEYLTTNIGWEGELGDLRGTWTVDTSDMPSDGSYEYVLDSGSKKLKKSFTISKSGIMTMCLNGSTETYYYLKRLD